MEFKQLSRKILDSFNHQFQAEKLQAEDLKLPENIITRKILFFDGFPQTILDNLRDEKEAKDIFENGCRTNQRRVHSIASFEAHSVLVSDLSEIKKENGCLFSLWTCLSSC
jgi:hypothetical protein